MSSLAGQGPATQTSRRYKSAEADKAVETFIRVGARLVQHWGVPMSHQRMIKHVRRYVREVSGFSFFDYFANAVHLDATRREESRDELEAYLRVTYALDPTGVTAVRNVNRERSRA